MAGQVEKLEQVMDSMFSSEEQKPDVKAKKPDVKQQESGTHQPEPGAQDDKNVEFRIKKHREERDEARNQNQLLREQLAKATGVIETTSKFYSADNPEVDPTEDMTETEKMLYSQNLQLKEELKGLTDDFKGVKNNAISNEFKSREDVFWKNVDGVVNTPEKKAEAKELIKGYLKDRPLIVDDVITGKISLKDVFEASTIGTDMAIVNNAKQDGSKFFGKGTEETPAPREEQAQANDWDTAKSILKNPDSENKGQAVKAGVGEIADDILKSMSDY